MRLTHLNLKPRSFAIGLLASGMSVLTASADIYEWEYIDPLQPELGKQESTTLVPDGAGVDAVPGADLSYLNLTKALIYGDLRDIDFTGATIREAYFAFARITSSQLYSTASYQAGDLTGISLIGFSVEGWDLSDQVLAGASFFHSIIYNFDFKDSDFTSFNNLPETFFQGGDFRRAVNFDSALINDGRTYTNLIYPDGVVRDGIGTPISHRKVVWIHDDDGGPTQTPIPITVQTAFDIEPDATLRFLIEDPSWGSTISFDSTVGTAYLAGTLELAMKLDEGLTPADLLGSTFDLFDWTGVTIDGAFDSILIDPAWHAAGLGFDVSQLMTTGEVSVVPLIGDLNADGFVGIDDLNIILTGWNQSVTPWDLAVGDVDGDGFVGIADLNLVLGTWNASLPLADSGGAAVPEPATTALLLLGSVGLLARRAS